MIDEKKLMEELIPILNEHGDMYLAGRIIGLIDSQPQADKWIPCSERLPEPNEDVLVYTNYGEMRVFCLEMRIIEGNFGRYVWKDLYGYWQELEIVEAWQPLPQPYKKEGAE